MKRFDETRRVTRLRNKTFAPSSVVSSNCAEVMSLIRDWDYDNLSLTVVCCLVLIREQFVV